MKPKKPTEPPQATTRGQFVELPLTDPRLRFDINSTQYNVTGNILGLTPETSYTKELLVYVHGYDNSEKDAKENFRIVKKALE